MPRLSAAFCLIIGTLLLLAGSAQANRLLDLPSDRPLLFALQAERGTLERVGRSRDRLVLTLRGLPTQGLWFTDRPARDTGQLPLRGFFRSWRRLGFVADPPNAVLSILGGRRRADALAVELRAPRYDARRRTVRFRVLALRKTSDGLHGLRHRLDRRIPARFGRSALFVDDAVVRSWSAYDECTYMAQATLFPAGIQTPGAFLRADGSVLAIQPRTALYALLMDTFGGDGRSTFALPNATAPAGLVWDLCDRGIFPSNAQYSGDEPALCTAGSLSLQAQTFRASGWLPADGRTLPVGQWRQLSESIGNRFGGDGTRTFALPRIPDQDGMRWYVCALGQQTFSPQQPTVEDCYMSQVSLFATPSLPLNYTPADGRVLPIVQNQVLFVLYGNAFGGDRARTFALPNLPGPVSGTSYGVCSSGMFPSAS